MQKVRIFILIIICSSFNPHAFAQRQADNWVFGNKAWLNFANGKATGKTGSALITDKGCASISDKNGNLQFYTDGETIWNRQHQVMANGAGLSGKKEALQSCIIIPQPGSNRFYYVFYQQPNPVNLAPNKLCYSLVDMVAQNGLGEVVAGSKNTVLYDISGICCGFSFTETLAAVHHANNQDVWLVTHRFLNYTTREFAAFKITSACIVSTPVLSNLPSGLHSFANPGFIRFSSDGKRILLNLINSDHRLVEFNNISGYVKVGIIKFGFGGYSTLADFSPDGSKLYVNELNKIYQYELSSNDSAAILASQTIITPPWPANKDYQFTDIKLANNGKIYALNDTLVYEIANPNAAGLACGFSTKPIAFAPANWPRNFYFPNFIQSYFAPPRFTFTEACSGNPVNFSIPVQKDITAAKWDFGDPASGSSNESTVLESTHVFTSGGDFTVTLTLVVNGITAVYERQISISQTPQVELGADTILCQGQNVTLQNQITPDSAIKYRWSTGDTTAAIQVSQAGTYWLEARNASCTSRDTLEVRASACLPPVVPNIITPNNDKLNDELVMENMPRGKWQLKIYNRWGKIIYESENYRNNWPEKEVADGVYYYLLIHQRSAKRYKGWVEVAQ